MSDDKRESKGARMLVVAPDQQEQTLDVAKALSSPHRLRILDLLLKEDANLSAVAKALGLPITTTTLHLGELEKAGLIDSRLVPAKRGQQRIYSRLYDFVVFHLPQEARGGSASEYMFDMPVGAFINHDVKPTCGLASNDRIIGLIDDPISFYDPERFTAQLVWFSEGFLEYNFPNRTQPNAVPRQLQISMEISSEAPGSNADWPSDIFMEINGVRVGMWTCPGEYADERGLMTPAWWFSGSAQYGLLKVWTVNESGSFIDGVRISDVQISDLNLSALPYIAMRIGVDPTAEHVGGLNLFGQGFGNYTQDIVLRLQY